MSKTRAIKESVYMVAGGAAVGNILGVLFSPVHRDPAVPRLSYFILAGCCLLALWAWRWRRPVKGYKYYPTDCDLQDSVYHKQAGFHCPRCALEIEE